MLRRRRGCCTPVQVALFHLRDAFRVGDVWLARSRRYGDIRKALLSAPAVADADQVVGDPRDDAVWMALEGRLAEPYARLPVSCVSVDAGYLTGDVKRQVNRRRWWIPTVGRAGEGKPIARRMSSTSGLCTLGADDGKAWWTGKVQAGNVHLPMTIDQPTIGQLCAAEALTAEGGKPRWRQVEGRQNHLFDCAVLAVHSRRYRTLARSTRRLRLVAV